MSSSPGPLPGTERAVHCPVVEFHAVATPVLFKDLLSRKALGIQAWVDHGLLQPQVYCGFLLKLLVVMTQAGQLLVLANHGNY